MFDFGFWELAMIVVVALVVVGPERLPGLAREAGVWVGRIKGLIGNAKREIRKEIRANEFQEMLNRQQKEIHELKGMLKETENEVKDELQETDQLVKSLEKEIEASNEALKETENEVKDELQETDQLVKSLEKQIEASNEVLKDAPQTPAPSYVERMTAQHDKSQKSG